MYMKMFDIPLTMLLDHECLSRGTKWVLGKPFSRMFGGHEEDLTWYILFLWNHLQDIFLLNNTVVDFILRETVSTQCILPLCTKTLVKRECTYMYMYSLYLWVSGTILEKHTRNFNRFAFGEVAWGRWEILPTFM